VPTSRGAAFQLFGFPVHVRPGFFMLLVLIMAVNGVSEFGFYMAAFIAAFTLLHELGHAFAARATGAEAQIALDFLAGYAAFTPTRPLSRAERAGISIAGPAVQIVAGVLVFLALGGSLSWPLHDLSHAQFAALWTGPAIGLFNLMPMLPLDGGNIASIGLEVISARHARTIMQWFTLAFAATVVVLLVLRGWSFFVPFVLFPVISVVESMTRNRTLDRNRATRMQLQQAEARAWASGSADVFPAGTEPSPWFLAAQQIREGNPDVARHIMLADLTDPEPMRWTPPQAAPLAQLAAVLAVLPNPVPPGRSASNLVLAGVMLQLGEYTQAGHFGAQAFLQSRSAPMALIVARAAAALGERDTALAWLRTAAQGSSPDALASAVAGAPEFVALRNDPEFVRVLSPA
jgi:Zn-dependent protease